MNEITRFLLLAHKCRNDRDVTRLWNWVDHFHPFGDRDQAAYWEVLLMVCPESFDCGHDTNSIRFAY